MNRIELNIVALAKSESSQGNYVLILEDEKGDKRLPIIIGSFEAQSIAVALQKVQPNRPLTHDLFKNTLDESGVSLTEVLIARMIDGVFHATLIGTKADGSALYVDARSSDAIALAIRFACPIFTTREVMDEAGFAQEDLNRESIKESRDLSEYSIKELEQLLEKVLEKEDYESASKIRDAIRAKG